MDGQNAQDPVGHILQDTRPPVGAVIMIYTPFEGPKPAIVTSHEDDGDWCYMTFDKMVGTRLGEQHHGPHDHPLPWHYAPVPQLKSAEFKVTDFVDLINVAVEEKLKELLSDADMRRRLLDRNDAAVALADGK